jgi:hypothetical protein
MEVMGAYDHFCPSMKAIGRCLRRPVVTGDLKRHCRSIQHRKHETEEGKNMYTVHAERIFIMILSRSSLYRYSGQPQGNYIVVEMKHMYLDEDNKK